MSQHMQPRSESSFTHQTAPIRPLSLSKRQSEENFPSTLQPLVMSKKDPQGPQKHQPNHCQGGWWEDGLGSVPPVQPCRSESFPCSRARWLSPLLWSRARAPWCNQLAGLGSSWQKRCGAQLPPLPDGGLAPQDYPQRGTGSWRQ